jgi:hypothetical protein
MKKFHPTNAALTKEEVVEMINERIGDEIYEGFDDLLEPQLNKLNDTMMQDFVDRWYDAMVDNLEFGDDCVGRNQEKVLLRLAKMIQ